MQNENPDVQSKEFTHEDSIIKESAYYLDQNSYHRDHMEDYCHVTVNFNDDKNKFIFAVHDGHSGNEVGRDSILRFPENFKKSLQEPGITIEDAITKGFKVTDAEFEAFDETGSTAVDVYTCMENDKRVIYSANCGDSRSILVREKEAIRLSYDHKASDPAEQKRAKKDRGLFFRGRLGGNLAITRGLGDFSFKKDGGYGLICDPYIKKEVLETTDRFIIIASDGVWDVIDEPAAYELCKDVKTAKEAAELFVTKAKTLGSKDNISCLAVKLN